MPRPIKVRNGKIVHALVPYGVYEAIRREALKRNITMSDVIREILTRWASHGRESEDEAVKVEASVSETVFEDPLTKLKIMDTKDLVMRDIRSALNFRKKYGKVVEAVATSGGTGYGYRYSSGINLNNVYKRMFMVKERLRKSMSRLEELRKMGARDEELEKRVIDAWNSIKEIEAKLEKTLGII